MNLKMFFSVVLLSLFSSTIWANSFSLSSNGFANHTIIPVEYTCEGKNISPALSWNNIPTGTKSLALIMDDKDAPTQPFFHWVIYNLPASTNSLAENISQLPNGALNGKNSWEKPGYKGPCPPKGKPHTYTFTLYALDHQLSFFDVPDGSAVIDAMENHVIDKATFSGVYER